MDLTSYAELAVRLVNTGELAYGRPDQLATIEAYRALVADRAQLSARSSPRTSTRSGSCAPNSG